MKIYLTHSISFDFKNELYLPVRNSYLNNFHEITLPHEYDSGQFNSKEFIEYIDSQDIIAKLSAILNQNIHINTNP